MSKKEILLYATEHFTKNYKEEPIFLSESGCSLPNRAEIIEIIRQLRNIIFPGYFSQDTMLDIEPDYYVGYCLNQIYDMLKRQICIALSYEKKKRGEKIDFSSRAEAICDRFFKELPNVQELLLKDLKAGFDGDPAAKSKEEIIFSYPGLFAIYVYRMAHIFYEEDVPFIPRIMSEYAHGKTGIDINPGAQIGEYFFIDHGTGIVIGETTVIGDHVKLYQGVTLGALSTRKGQELSGTKRHPTIQGHVTIYANSTVLGGTTVIGEHTIIGGNTFITESIPPYSKVRMKSPELIIQEARKETSKEVLWEYS
ncbi:MAG: serine acetyltransferase [Firmicutes bacterium]|uniref:Serine acetyltransferase n=1 Tax=Candidatus Scybalomonas excrementavium TaxID=2840943 RepID=A0A9D9I1F8_9FIRM|nr:serine acetyltransferase [Candidatus Scybalomonas excrementavium]